MSINLKQLIILYMILKYIDDFTIVVIPQEIRLEVI